MSLGRLSFFAVLTVFLNLLHATAAPTTNSSGPIVNLLNGSFQGRGVDGLDQFLGIPFAAPPIGQRRFGFPEPLAPFSGIRQAVEFGASCPQQAIQTPQGIPALSKPASVSEDCLFINIVRPSNIAPGKKLPILFFFYGGAFEVGDGSLYPGINLVKRSVALGEPIIYVSANYRGNAFGFLGGKEVKDRGLTNIGLRDQRFALQWVQDNIGVFGGDSEKVTIWGQSAGAISVGLHLLLDGGNTGGLFSGAIMESGAPIALPDVLEQQVYFDNLVSATNCSSASDRFECLKCAPFAAIQAAVDASPGYFSFPSLNLAWVPVVDGTLIPGNPLRLVGDGKYAKVPFIAGNTEDEGTLFSLSNLNITTNVDFLQYLKQNYLSYVTDDKLQALAAAYPDDITLGSPFNTGTANALTPEFKRLAAVQGDLIFQAPRRWLLQVASKTQPAFGYRFVRGSSTPTLGAFHGSDVPYFFGFDQTDFIGTDALIYFARNCDPNPPFDSISLLRKTSWPKWSSDAKNPPLLSFFDPAPFVNITVDTYRSKAIALLIQLRSEPA